MGEMRAGGVALLTLALLASIPNAQATGAGVPLPPVDVQAVVAESGGAVVSWVAPVYDGGHSIFAYHVYRMVDAVGPVWQEVGTTDGSTTSFLDAAGVALATYHVTAENEVGPSFQSNPASAEDREMCSILVLSGIPPQAGINWQCIPLPMKVWTWLKLEI